MEPRDDPPPVDVLIADNDPVVRDGMRRVLEQEGYSCAEAEEGQQAMEMIQHTKPRCVFLDLAMPSLDGLTVARMVRADPRARGVHLNCLSNLPDEQAREQARLAGCEAFLTKPVNRSALLDVVHRQVRHPGTGELSGLTKGQAEILLDLLEAGGCSDLESFWEETGFKVLWTSPPGRPLEPDRVRELLERV